jgi:hypothetical protein
MTLVFRQIQFLDSLQTDYDNNLVLGPGRVKSARTDRSLVDFILEEDACSFACDVLGPIVLGHPLLSSANNATVDLTKILLKLNLSFQRWAPTHSSVNHIPFNTFRLQLPCLKNRSLWQFCLNLLKKSLCTSVSFQLRNMLHRGI